jgi:hypothetical protein
VLCSFFILIGECVSNASLPSLQSKKEVVMYDLKAMVSLHARLIRAQRILYRIECQWEHIVERVGRRCFFLAYIVFARLTFVV